MITKTQWDNFKKQLRQVRKTNAVIYTRDSLIIRKLVKEHGLPSYTPPLHLTVLSVPMDEEYIYLSNNVKLSRDAFKDLTILHELFYIERSLDEYIKELKEEE